MKKVTAFLLGFVCCLSAGVWAEEPNYVAQLGETKYETLQAAIDDAENGAVITLLADAQLEGLSVSGKAVIIVHTKTAEGATQYFLKLGNAYIGEQKDSATIPLLNSVEVPGGDKISPAVNAECVTKYTYSSNDHTWKQPIALGDLTNCVALATGSEYIPTTTKQPYLISYFISKSITLNEDIELPLRTTISGNLNFCGDELVFDLNGHTLKQDAYVDGYPAVAVKAGSLTIKDSVGDGQIIGATNALIVEGGANCVVESGSIMTLGCWKDDFVGACVTVQTDAILEIKGGTFGDDSYYVENPKTSGTIWAMNGTINITGGVFTGTENENAWDGTAICAYSYTAGKTASVTISGNPEIFGWVYPYQTQGKASMVISGGTFDTDVNEYYGKLTADGYVVWFDTEKKLYSVVEAVAEVVNGESEVLYATLKEAFAAANGKTVKLLKNQKLDVTNAADSLTVPKGATITFDMNGYILAGYATKANSSQLISNLGTLIIMDSSDTEKDGDGYGCLISSADPAWQYDGGDDYSGSYASNLILNKGNLIVESGYLENAAANSSATYVVDNNSSGSNASLTVNGGWLYQYYTQAIRQFANSTTYENNVTINGGIVEGYYFEWLQLPGNNISVAPKANLTVNGGYLKNTDASGNGYAFYAYSYGNSRRNVTVKITGGFWYGWVAFTGGGDKSTIENIEITGGYYDTDILSFAWSSSNPNEATKSAKFIKGGCFATLGNWRAGVCPGYGIYDNKDPYTMDFYPYEVRPIPVVELKVTENEVPIKVQEEVLFEIVGDDVLEALESEDPEVRAEAEQAVSEKLQTTESNGLEVWQNYVLGLNGAMENLSVTTEDNSASKIEIVPVTDPAPNSGFTVSYKMDYTDAEETTTTLDTLDIELEGEKDPTGVYQVKALLTPENGGDPIVVETKNKVGVVKAIQPMELVIVSVPWKKLSLAAHSEDIPVADLVKTTTLDEGDMLLDYNGTNYDAWRLTAGKTWESVGIVKKTENGMELVESPDPAKTTVKRGSGVFLKRKDPSKPYYLYGQVDDSEVVEALPEKINLVANPNVTDFDLNAEGAIKASAYDTILIPTARAPKKCTMKDGKWGYMTHYVDQLGIVREKRVEEVKIPAGTGFWYEKGSSDGSSEINWSK